MERMLSNTTQRPHQQPLRVQSNCQRQIRTRREWQSDGLMEYGLASRFKRTNCMDTLLTRYPATTSGCATIVGVQNASIPSPSSVWSTHSLYGYTLRRTHSRLITRQLPPDLHPKSVVSTLEGLEVTCKLFSLYRQLS